MWQVRQSSWCSRFETLKIHWDRLVQTIHIDDNCSLAAALSTKIDSILLNFIFFYCDADVTAMELCNVIMK